VLLAGGHGVDCVGLAEDDAVLLPPVVLTVELPALEEVEEAAVVLGTVTVLEEAVLPVVVVGAPVVVVGAPVVVVGAPVVVVGAAVVVEVTTAVLVVVGAIVDVEDVVVVEVVVVDGVDVDVVGSGSFTSTQATCISPLARSQKV